MFHVPGFIDGLFKHNTTQQHYFTKNRKKEKKNLSETLHFNLVPRSLQRTFEQFSCFLPLKISD